MDVLPILYVSPSDDIRRHKNTVIEKVDSVTYLPLCAPTLTKVG